MRGGWKRGVEIDKIIIIIITLNEKVMVTFSNFYVGSILYYAFCGITSLHILQHYFQW